MLDSLLSAIAPMLDAIKPLFQSLQDSSLPFLANLYVQITIAAIGFLITSALLVRRNKKRKAAKATALRLLHIERATISPSAAMEVLRQAVLCYYPPQHIAGLSGSQWLKFLDTQAEAARFEQNAQHWKRALSPQYNREQPDPAQRQELIEQCVSWLEQTLPPSRQQTRQVANRPIHQTNL